MITFRPGSITLMLELLIGEAVFAWSCPKRSYFWLRLIGSIAICLTAAYFFPFVKGGNYSLFSLGRIILLLLLSYGAVWFCFDIKPFAVLTIVASGDALQHIGNQTLNFFLYLPFENEFLKFIKENVMVFELILCVLVSIGGFFLFGISFWKKKLYERYEKHLSIISFSTIFICLGVARLVNLIPGQSRNQSISSFVFCILCCSLALIIEFTIWEIATLNTKNALLSMQIKEERKQFEETKKIMETLNQRGHDLKHLLQDYSGNLPEKYLKTVREEVQLYENRYITDNPSLDVLLTNFNYKYGKLGVKLKFVGDSSLLKFMDEMDMVVLFDNALENAVDAVLKVGQEKRTIQIILDKKGNMISLVFINYFDGKLQIKNQKLQSSKESKNLYEHGVGLASMKAIANNYDGNIDFYTENEKFYLNVYLFDNSQAKF